MSDVKVLDCTLRDGGYYCNWCYEADLVATYLEAIASSNLDYVEIGLRSNVKDKFLGPFAFCTDEFLNELNLPTNTTVGVMINAGEYIQNEKADVPALNLAFKNCADSPVGLVRIAAHYHEVPACREITKVLKEKGYTVGLNLMQSSTKTAQHITETVKEINTFGSVDALYFADSLGNMNTEKVLEILNIFKENWNGPIGIHAHDNMGNALNNTITSLKNGATWLDSTILGMGRGAGNTRTEYLLIELEKLGHNKYSPQGIFNLVLGPFKQLQEKYEWGPSLLYYLSAEHNIHPTFIQELLNNKNLDPHQLIDTLETLKSASNSTSFNKNALLDAMKDSLVDSDGDWSPSEALENKDVLILGSGPGLKEHSSGIINYIKTHKPVVISLNLNKYISGEHISMYAACHPTRLMLDFGKYKNLKKPLILPLKSINESDTNILKDVKTHDFGIKIANTFEITEKGCTLPTPLVLAYALAISTAGKAKQILLAGFDGYQSNDPRQSEVVDIFNQYKKASSALNITSITPTTYPVNKTSVYSPFI